MPTLIGWFRKTLRGAKRIATEMSLDERVDNYFNSDPELKKQRPYFSGDTGPGIVQFAERDEPRPSVIKPGWNVFKW